MYVLTEKNMWNREKYEMNKYWEKGAGTYYHNYSRYYKTVMRKECKVEKEKNNACVWWRIYFVTKGF